MGIRVAVDFLGAGDAPTIAAGVCAALDADPTLHVVAVGAAPSAIGLAPHPRVTVVTAHDAVGPDDDPVQAVRARRDVSVRVATRCVRDRDADAVMSCGPVAATTAAAGFVLGQVRGVTRPALASMLPTARGETVLLDVDGAAATVTPQLLVEHAVIGAAVADCEQPLVGLLAPAAPPSTGAGPRAVAHDLLTSAAGRFAGPVTVADAVRGACDVVVTDGFTGAAVLGALAAAAPDRYAERPALLVGVGAAAVAGSAASAGAVAAAVGAAAAAARRDVAARVATAAAGIVSRRRELAGLR